MLVNNTVNNNPLYNVTPDVSLADLRLPPREISAPSIRQSHGTELALTPLEKIGVWADLPEWYDTPITLERAIETLTPPSIRRALDVVEADPSHFYTRNNIVPFDRLDSAPNPTASNNVRPFERVASTPALSEGALSAGQLLRTSSV